MLVALGKTPLFTQNGSWSHEEAGKVDVTKVLKTISVLRFLEDSKNEDYALA